MTISSPVRWQAARSATSAAYLECPQGSEGAGESSSRQGRPGSISPSALMLLTKIKRLAPARAAAAATRSVPATLASWQAARHRGDANARHDRVLNIHKVCLRMNVGDARLALNRRGARAFFSEIAQGASAKTV